MVGFMHRDNSQSILFSIGHSSHLIEVFIGLLRRYEIETVADVRSSPYSRYSPQFNRDVLETALRNAQIRYVFLGRELGARRAEDACHVDGQARYDRIAQLPTFRRGLERVLHAVGRYRVALMCAESDPIACHRTILVCRELKRICPNLEIAHILRDGTTERQEMSETRLVNLHKLQPELFGGMTSASDLIEKAYDLQAEKIAYKKLPAET